MRVAGGQIARKPYPLLQFRPELFQGLVQGHRTAIRTADDDEFEAFRKLSERIEQHDVDAALHELLQRSDVPDNEIVVREFKFRAGFIAWYNLDLSSWTGVVQHGRRLAKLPESFGDGLAYGHHVTHGSQIIAFDPLCDEGFEPAVLRDESGPVFVAVVDDRHACLPVHQSRRTQHLDVVSHNQVWLVGGNVFGDTGGGAEIHASACKELSDGWGN